MIERRGETMSIPGEFERPPRTLAELAPGTALPWPVSPIARPPVGLAVVGALLGASLTGAAGRGGATGSGCGANADPAPAARDDVGAGGSGIPATGIAADAVADGGIPRPPRPLGLAFTGAAVPPFATVRGDPGYRGSVDGGAMRASSGRAVAGSPIASASGDTDTIRS